MPGDPGGPDEAFPVSGSTGGVTVGVGDAILVGVGVAVGVSVCRGARVAAPPAVGVGLGSSGVSGLSVNEYACADFAPVVCTASK